MHPWIDDPQKELERLEKQRQKEQEEMQQQAYNPFAPQGNQQPNKEGDPNGKNQKD